MAFFLNKKKPLNNCNCIFPSLAWHLYNKYLNSAMLGEHP